MTRVADWSTFVMNLRGGEVNPLLFSPCISPYLFGGVERAGAAHSAI